MATVQVLWAMMGGRGMVAQPSSLWAPHSDPKPSLVAGVSSQFEDMQSDSMASLKLSTVCACMCPVPSVPPIQGGPQPCEAWDRFQATL